MKKSEAFLLVSFLLLVSAAPVLGDPGDIAIYREVAAGDVIGKTAYTHTYDTTVRDVAGIYSLIGETDITLGQAGHYMALYTARADDADHSHGNADDRLEAQSWLNLGEGASFTVGGSSAVSVLDTNLLGATGTIVANRRFNMGEYDDLGSAKTLTICSNNGGTVVLNNVDNEQFADATTLGITGDGTLVIAGTLNQNNGAGGAGYDININQSATLIVNGTLNLMDDMQVQGDGSTLGGTGTIDHYAMGGNTAAVKEAKSQLKNYFAMVTGVDEQFGRIVKAIGAAGLADNTIVVFTSDHGNCLGSHNQRTKNVHWEESMRVPFLIRYPGTIKPRRDDLLLSTVDIYPTLLDLMGLADKVPPGVQGASHARLFRTGEGPRPTSQLYMWVLVDKPALGRRGVRTARYTLMIDKMPSKPVRTVLFDNVRDPYQLKDIAAERPDLVKTLTETELVPWLKKTGDPWRPA